MLILPDISLPRTNLIEVVVNIKYQLTAATGEKTNDLYFQSTVNVPQAETIDRMLFEVNCLHLVTKKVVRKFRAKQILDHLHEQFPHSQWSIKSELVSIEF